MASSPVHHLRVRLLLLLALYLASASAWPSWPWRRTLSAQHDYRDALSKCILFFEGQRSGRLPPSQRAAWRGDSGLTDGQAAGVRMKYEALSSEQKKQLLAFLGSLQQLKATGNFCLPLVVPMQNQRDDRRDKSAGREAN
jgi:hypothetical protein